MTIHTSQNTGNNPNTFTLLNATNHAATREEVQQVRTDLGTMSGRLMTAISIGFTAMTAILGWLVYLISLLAS